MKGKNNSKSTNKSPNKNLKQDEMKKNPILPNKKGNGKKDVVKEEPKPKKIELPIIENNQIDKKEKLKKERELRLKREKENEKKDQEIFEKILEEAYFYSRWLSTVAAKARMEQFRKNTFFRVFQP